MPDGTRIAEKDHRGYVERDGLLPSVHVYSDVLVPALARDPRFHSLLERMHLTDVASSISRRPGAAISPAGT